MERTAKNDWDRVRSIFDDALRQPVEERLKFVRTACADNEELSAEVESLLESFDSAEQFLETPAVVKVADDTKYSDQQLSPGRMLLHYEIRELLGTGGMGEVYLARDTRLNRNVAIKVLRSGFLPDAEAKRRLLREARAAALLEHPNICQTYEISETDEHSFIVMQYVVGTTLAGLLESGKLSASSSVDLAIQIADGLSEAHQQGIIHRDIKPANIIVNNKSQAKILDFGLAKFIEAETISETAKRLDSSGAVMGTVPFMSPEQLCGKALDARSDLFSLGALLYEMLTGKPAFAKDNNAETISAVLNDEPEWRPIAQPLRRIVQKCLAKEITLRYDSATSLLHDLREVRNNGALAESPIGMGTMRNERVETGDLQALKKRSFHFWQSFSGGSEDLSSAPTLDDAVGVAGHPTRGVSRSVIVAASLLVLVLGLAGVWVWISQTNKNANSNFDSLQPVRLVSWKSGAVTRATDHRISNDGRMIAYSSSNRGANEEIYIKQTSDGQEFQVTRDIGTNISPIWSPDDQKLAFVSIRENQAGIYVSPILGGAVTPLKLTAEINISLRHWSRDGASIYYDQAGNFFRLNVQSGESVKVSDLPDVPGVSGRFFVVSPDETRIAFTDIRDGQKDLWTIPISGGEATRITNDKESERRAVWHPDGERLFYNVAINDVIQINIIAADGNSRPVPVTRGEGRYSLIDVSPDGDRIYYATTEARSDISSVVISTGGQEELAATPTDAELWADVSPDGNSVVYHTISSQNPSARIANWSLMIKTAGSTDTPLPNTGFDARWLPDGRHISLFRTSVTRANDFDAWIVDTVTGTETLMAAERVLTPTYSMMPISRVDVGVLDFSSDSKRVVYVGLDQPRNVKLGEIGSGFVQSLTTNENPRVEYFSPKFSRDGGRIAIVSRERFQDEARERIWRLHIIEGSDIREVYSATDALRLIGWSSGGEMIVATGKGNLESPIDVGLLAFSSRGLSRRLSTLASAYARTITMSRDGTTVAFTVNRDDRDDIWTMSLLPRSVPRQVTANSTTRQFITNLVFSPDGKRIYFDKQEEINTISMFENLN